MSAAITKVHQAELAEREPEGVRFSDKERAMIRDAYARGADEAQFRVLIAIAEARGLDPRKGMVHFVSRKEYVDGRETGRVLWAVQPSIDYFRSAAEATGLYDGQDAPEYEHDPKTGALISCTVRVWRKGWARPMAGVARLSEFGASNKMWRQMPHNMLAKCAESQALRKAFPRRLGGLYTPDEMAQAESDERHSIQRAPEPAQLTDPPFGLSDGEAREVERKQMAISAAGKRASELASSIEACTEAMGLDVVGRRVGHAAKAGEITLDQAADLKERGKRKRTELRAAAEQAAADHAHEEQDAVAEHMGDLPTTMGGTAEPEPGSGVLLGALALGIRADIRSARSREQVQELVELVLAERDRRPPGLTLGEFTELYEAARQVCATAGWAAP